MNHMRQGQNSKRSRGRGGRKPQNPGNRAYDSNGPDVKIRGTAAHVCEKYQQLARDAISAGDRVMAENYYQHAEHYYRLLMASQVVGEGQVRPQNTLGYRPDEDQDDEDEDFGTDQPQPHFPNQPYHQPSQNFHPRHNQNGGQNGNGQNGRSYNNPAPGQGGEEGTEQAAGGEARGEFQGLPGGPNSGGQGSDGQRRGRGRRRRQRHDNGGMNAGGDNRQGGNAGPDGSSGDHDGGEAASSGGNDEAPVA